MVAQADKVQERDKEYSSSELLSADAKPRRATEDSYQEGASHMGAEPLTKRVDQGSVGLDEFGKWKMDRFRAFARDVLIPVGKSGTARGDGNNNDARNRQSMSQQRPFDGYREEKGSLYGSEDNAAQNFYN